MLPSWCDRAGPSTEGGRAADFDDRVGKPKLCNAHGRPGRIGDVEEFRGDGKEHRSARRNGDAAGDACDFDADGDGVPNTLEQWVGADPLDPASVPEYVGAGDSCANRVDDDRDGGIDSADPGCQDADTDGFADGDVNCPTSVNPSQRDTDGDGLGDACDLVVRVDWVRFASLPATNSGIEFYWSATRAGTFSVRSGGIDCVTGSVIDSGAYDPGTYDAARGEEQYSALAIVPPTALVAGENVLRVCVAAGSERASATTTITVSTDSTPSSS